MPSPYSTDAIHESAESNPWSKAAGWGLLTSGIGAGLKGAFGRDKPDFTNPADAAKPYLDRIPETMNPYFQPAIDRGNRSGDALERQYGEMTNDPSALLSRLGSGYKESPGYQFKLHQALAAANNASAAGGMLGSNQHQFQNEEIGEGLASQDYEGWLNHVLGLYGSGQEGLRDFNHTGTNASTEYGTNLAQALNSQANNAASGAAERNKYDQEEANQESSGWGDIAGLGIKAASLFL